MDIESPLRYIINQIDWKVKLGINVALAAIALAGAYYVSQNIWLDILDYGPGRPVVKASLGIGPCYHNPYSEDPNFMEKKSIGIIFDPGIKDTIWVGSVYGGCDALPHFFLDPELLSTEPLPTSSLL